MNIWNVFTVVRGAIIAITLVVLMGHNPTSAQETRKITPNYLRCEYRVNPLGIDVALPRLSWVVESNERSQKQTAYRILVAGSPEKLNQNTGDLWDTGKVKSDETIHIAYGGKPLKSRMFAYWKVQVWDGQDMPSAWSETALWSTGLLKAEDWMAEWIGYDVPLSNRQKLDLQLQAANVHYKRFKCVYLPSPYLRTDFHLDKAVRRAVVYVTALGLYELHLNGRRVGNDYFTPGWSDYRKRVYYQTYDVTDLLRPGGENVVGAILSDGWYAGNISNQGQRHYGDKLRLRLQMHIEYEDGSEQVVASDGNWRASDGAIREGDIQDGETYDSRREMVGWSGQNFDDNGWKPVVTDDNIKIMVQAYPGIPVHGTMEIKPIALTEPKPSVFVYNLGQNFSGWARLRVRGKAGDKVVLRFAEMLNPDGTIYTTNLRGARATDTYILKGGGEEVWEPRFTFHGFQYVEVTGYPGKPDMETITGIVAHSDLPVVGSFECSNPLVNKLYSNIVWGQRSNYFEVPTDCPQRDERLGWTGDAQVFVRTASYNMDIGAFFTKWLVDLEDGQFEDGSFPSVAPTVHGGTAAGWGDAGVVCPWTIHRVYGDTRILEKHYDAMVRWVDFLDQRSKGHFSPPLGSWGDWLHIDAPTPLELIATAYFARSASLMADMARAVGRDGEAEKYEKMFNDISSAFTNRFVTSDGKVYGDTQTAYLMALGFNLLPDKMRPRAAERLVDRLRERDWRLSTGFLGLNLLLPTLTKVGRIDLAYRLLTNREFPSWGYTIDQGATTIWERWNSFTKENGFNDPGMNSFNHYAFGSVGEWMFSTLAGIDTDGAGFKRIIIRPQPGGDITWVRAGYNSIRGNIAVEWKFEGDDLILNTTIPANTTATVYIPAKNEGDVTESKGPAGQSPGVRLLRMESGAAVFEIGSGSYSFVSKGAKSILMQKH
ncbi:MAG: glycoside hydrolase family 78 protein [bacterium]